LNNGVEGQALLGVRQVMVRMNEMSKTYYPPRARWYSPVFYFWFWLRRRLHLESIRLPSAANVRRVLLGVVLPGYACAAYGRRTTALAIYCGYALAAAVFIVWLGYSISSLALGMMASLHVASVLYLVGRRPVTLAFPRRAALSLAVFSAVYFCIYYPLQSQFEKRIGMPLRVGNKVIMVKTHAPAGAVKQGDWVAYRLDSLLRDNVYLAAGFGFGQVEAVAGDRVVFTARDVQVNGAEFPRRAHMPVNETWVVPEKHWFIWPDSAISTNVRNDAVARLMRESAVVAESQFVGKPFRRWFWRRQTLP
jgi:hypothetical protein